MIDPDGVEPITPPAPEPEPERVWKVDRTDREYIQKPEGRGVIYRHGTETVAEALARDQLPRDQRPRRKPKRPKMPDAPRKIDLKELELTLAEALKAPAVMCASFGDEWAAEHFTTTGPYLARNLILASEHNPWLRRKLEESATGQDAMMKLVSLVGVGGALVSYTVPVIIYWANLPVPERTRIMFGIPPRKEQAPAYAAADNGQPEPAPQGAFPA